MSTFDPPFAQRHPITARDPSRPLRGVDWQYGFSFRGPHTALQADPPPVRSIAAAVAVVMAWWTPPIWNAQDAPNFTPSGPPPVIKTPAPNIPAFYAVRQAWADATWSAQSAPDFVQIKAGDEPPGQVTGGAEAPDLLPFGYYDGWRAQSAAPVAALIPPLVQTYIPPNDFPYSAFVAWQLAPTWSAQSEPDGAPYATIIYGQQPQPTSIAAFVGLRSAWADATWFAQSEADAAPLVPPPVTNQPIPVSGALFASIRGIWADPTWNAQRPYSSIAPLTLVYGQQPPEHSVAPIASLRATWADASWFSQRPFAAPVAPPRVDAPPPTTTALQHALRATWPNAQWAEQSSSTLAPLIPIPIVITASSGQVTVVYGDVSVTIRGPDSTTVNG